MLEFGATSIELNGFQFGPTAPGTDIAASPQNLASRARRQSTGDLALSTTFGSMDMDFDIGAMSAPPTGYATGLNADPSLMDPGAGYGATDLTSAALANPLIMGFDTGVMDGGTSSIEGTPINMFPPAAFSTSIPDPQQQIGAMPAAFSGGFGATEGDPGGGGGEGDGGRMGVRRASVDARMEEDMMNGVPNLKISD